MSNCLQRLDYQVMKYDWGHFADKSCVAQLYRANGHLVDPNQRYAELWVGAHVNAPTRIKGGGVLPPNLPYLFKVLSIEKPLSIQSHPDKKLAESLHSQFPNVYKDDNHKPEMMVAITPAEAFCGFISNHRYQQLLSTYPILKSIFKNSSNVEQSFKVLMKLNDCEIKDAIQSAMSVIPINHIFRTIKDNFGFDVGVLCSLILAYHQLNAGEAMYIGPNIPHSYISGDLVEIMATSDNVIRAGCTTKFIDKQILCQSLNYQAVGYYPIQGHNDGYLTTYTPPVSEFKLQRIVLLHGQHYLYNANAGTIIFVLEGKGQCNTNCVSAGQAFWTHLPQSVNFECDSNQLVIWISSDNRDKGTLSFSNGTFDLNTDLFKDRDGIVSTSNGPIRLLPSKI